MTTLTSDPTPPSTPIGRLPRWRIALWGGALLALALPYLTMQVSSEMNWTGFDFLVFGLMLAVACGGVELAVHLSDKNSYRIAAILALGGGFLMVWANLAVGIIGNENNPQNMLFFGVLAAGLIGALLARFKACGLAATLRVMAVLQLLLGIAAWALGWAFLPVFTLFYVALWWMAARLFAKACPLS